jgi:hypothetical protein
MRQPSLPTFIGVECGAAGAAFFPINTALLGNSVPLVLRCWQVFTVGYLP